MGTTMIPTHRGTQPTVVVEKFGEVFEEVATLPLPTADLLDKIVRVRNVTTSKLYVCMQNLTGDYEWIQLAISNK